MNVPAIAKKTYDEVKNIPEYKVVFNFIMSNLSRLSDKYVRAKLVHEIVDEFNQEAFSHPLVQELSPCRLGCSACCHTQVSVTEDEAALLVQRIAQGVKIDRQRLKLQAQARNDSEAYFKIQYQDRKCVFLNDEGACAVYEDRPSVCRTNAVLGEASQCDTSEEQGALRLVKTTKADLAIYASFIHAPKSGTLPYMLSELLD